MLEVIGLSKVTDTIVGENDLRRISSSQCRCLTVGEMLLSSNAKILHQDDIANTLASTDAIKLIKFIAMLYETKSASVMVTL